MTGHPAYGVLRAVSSTASVLLADNPSPMTLEGTNTWVLRAPGAATSVVVDPGPDDERHLAGVAAAAPDAAVVLLTHRHADHAAGARRLAELDRRTGAGARPGAGARRRGTARRMMWSRPPGCVIRVLGTPGHTSDSLCFALEGPVDQGGGPAVLTGDTVLGRGTTVIDHPDGRLGDYLASLRRLAELAPGTAVLPGHGPELPDAATVAAEYLAHREQRLDQVRSALDVLGPDATARQIVELVYADVDRALWPAAEWSVRAQLAYLRER